ncbi:hypothetical protein DYB25_000022 [Aphanomyces astaci]|uniref:Uncharacterized protein n=1 Tax=Aphanomyces astaci TaxID=112090 RepID=A0A397EXP6_APHAT|nr:hypothetical protein DYB36_002241 [Aphanomyces astaci]RHY16385.1 hypothetical protein DYB25_000022 [Aphanomyces astaci]RHY40740.1 hypothetical protein DYB38_003457 [Aphanomyces astaci]RHY55592.1 hypothetical protein DYB34_001483 [Aphanomyces astaci]RHZ08688.1 hypothetical protein DYB31_000152 [Aphanomyces astaci]
MTAKPPGLTLRLKDEDAAKKAKATRANAVIFGIPVAIVLLAIWLSSLSVDSGSLLSDWTRRWVDDLAATLIPSQNAGWLPDVADQKQRGDILVEANHLQPALVYYHNALKLAVQHDHNKAATPDESKRMRSHLANSMAMTYVKLGNDTQAATWYKHGLDVDDNNAELHYNYANLCVRQEKWVPAEAHYRKVLELKPLNPPAMLSLAYVLQQEGALDEARTLLLEAWDVDNTDADIAAQLGYQYMAETDVSNALEWLNTAADMGHEEAALQRNELLSAWMRTQEQMTAGATQGSHDGDTMTLEEPVL